MPAIPVPSKTRLVYRALRRHCPACGGGNLFRRWFTMADRCPTCGLASDRVAGHWIGAVGINTIPLSLIGNYLGPKREPECIVTMVLFTKS